MASMEFKVRPHGILPGSQMVEVWRNGVFVAGVFPHEDGIRVLSKYMTRTVTEDGLPPAVVIYLGKEAMW